MSGAAEAEALARGVLAGWGGALAPPRLVQISENIVFEARLARGERVALRLHRPGYQDEAAILAELEFMRALAAAGMTVPEPVAMDDGGLIGRGEGRLASCVRWIDGVPVGPAVGASAADPMARRRLFAAIGELLGRLHDAADGWAGAAALARWHWDGEGLLGEAPHWGRVWDNPLLPAGGRDLLLQARAMAVARLGRIAPRAPEYGPIHADVLGDNLLATACGLVLIDFDDCGHGYRLYDLATALVKHLEEPDLPALVAALIRGYAAVRPLPEVTGPDLGFFVMLRAFASAGWIDTRAGCDDPRRALYLGRALRMARLVLDGKLPWAAG